MLICIQVAPMQETKTEKLIHAIVDRDIRGECFHIERLRLKKYRGKMRKVKDRIFPGYIFVDTDDFDEFYDELKRVPKLTSVVLAKAAWQPDLFGWTGFCQLTEEEEYTIRSLIAGSKTISDGASGSKAVSDGTAGRKPLSDASIGNSTVSDGTAGQKTISAGNAGSAGGNIINKSPDSGKSTGSLVIGLSQVIVEPGKQMVVVSGPLKGHEGLIKKVDLHRREATVELSLMGRKMDVLLGIELMRDKPEKET